MGLSIIALFALSISIFVATAQEKQVSENPFDKLGYDPLVATSSRGEFAEFHDQADIVEIGSVLFNTKTNEVVKILNDGETTIDLSSATAAISIDPLCEKYYWISPYAYCANNPIRFIDLRGDSISVAEEHRDQFNSDLNKAFGDRASSLSFNSSGNLVLNGKEKDFTKGMTKDQKNTYEGLKKAMDNKETVSVEYSNQYSSSKAGGLNSTDIVKDWGGGVYSAIDQVIVISPTVGSVSVNLTLEGVQATGSFTETVQQNVTSTLFHEIGEFNTPRSDTKRGTVIDYENSVRNILGLPKRPYDLYHHK